MVLSLSLLFLLLHSSSPDTEPAAALSGVQEDIASPSSSSSLVSPCALWRVRHSCCEEETAGVDCFFLFLLLLLLLVLL